MDESGLIFKFGREQVIFRQGERGDCAYLIKDGSVDISVERDSEVILIDRLLPGQLFGELALVDDVPRSATATTATGCVLLAINRSFIDREIAALDPFMQYWIANMAKQIRRMLRRTDPMTDRRASLRSESGAAARTPGYGPGFGEDSGPRLTERVWAMPKKAAVYDRRLFTPGQVIFREGEPGFKAFMIRTGAVRITRIVDHERKILNVLKANQIFGELALIDEQPRSATATAVAATEVMVVDGALFRRRLENSSRFMQYWARALANRLRDLSARVIA